MNNENNFIKL